MAYIPEFGDAVREAVAGRPYRSLAAKSGLSPAYIADMVQGRVPRREAVIAFAQAAGSDVNALLAKAKYPSLEEADWNPDIAFNSLVRELRQEYADVAASLSFQEVIAADATPEEVEAIGRVLRERCEELRNAKGGGRGAQVGKKGGERRAGPGRLGGPRLCAA